MIPLFHIFQCYTFRQTCQEQPEIEYEDGLRILYFNTDGKKGGSTEIENVLRYLQSVTEEYADDAKAWFDVNMPEAKPVMI